LETPKITRRESALKKIGHPEPSEVAGAGPCAGALRIGNAQNQLTRRESAFLKIGHPERSAAESKDL
jgi:hypothetical protein